MKISWPAVGLLSCAALARALDFTTDDGQVLKDARLLRVSKGQVCVSHADGVATLALTPKVAADFQIAAGSDTQELPDLVKLDLENWLMEIKNTSATYRRPKPQATRVSQAKPVKVAKPASYQAAQFAKQYVPDEDEGRRVTLTGLVTDIIGRKDTFKIIIDDAVVIEFKTGEIPKVMDGMGNARAIGPYKVSENITVIGHGSGMDDDNRILFNGASK